MRRHASTVEGIKIQPPTRRESGPVPIWASGNAATRAQALEAGRFTCHHCAVAAAKVSMKPASSRVLASTARGRRHVPTRSERKHGSRLA